MVCVKFLLPLIPADSREEGWRRGEDVMMWLEKGGEVF